LKEIAALGIEGAISIELEYSPQPERIAEWVAEAYSSTDKLMKAAGIERG
jgi:D-psicose/D-tagatose/L-ribulose 3-epimerase